MNGEFFRWLKLRWRGLFHRRAHEAALDRELQYHLDMLVAENIAAGMSADEARFAAQREFGGAAQVREACRDSWRSALLSGLLSDFAFAFRGLRRSPGFTIVAVCTLALGIGVNATIFSFVRDGLIRPLARDHRLNLVSLYNARVGPDQNFRRFSYLEFQALRESADVFTDIAAQSFLTAAVGPEGNLQTRMINFVSENFFSVLGVRPMQGRVFSIEESQPGASIPVLVASYSLWERLGRPENFVGSTLRINQRTYSVIGLMPRDFVGLNLGIGPDLWLPLGENTQVTGRDLRQPELTGFSLIARLQPGLSLASARQHLGTADRRLNSVPSIDHGGLRRLVIDAPRRTDLGASQPQDESFISVFATLGLGLSFMVLMVACLNLANMLLARGSARQKEIAIRLALGASRWRVVRSLLAEGFLVALMGGALSLILALWSNDLLIRWYISALDSGMFGFGWPSFFDGTIVVATLGFCFIATLAFSLWPALRLTRPDLTNDLKQVPGSSRSPARGSRFLSLSHAPIIVAQVALSLALLFSAALFVRSANNATSLGLGFQTAHELVANVDYTLLKLDAAQLKQRQQLLLASGAALPGVTSAALASNIPYNFALPYRPVRALDGPAAAGVDPTKAQRWCAYTAVTRGYFSTLGIDLLYGRDFTPEESAGADYSHPVVIVDELFARMLFGNADPLGRHITTENTATPETTFEIVGVVRSHRAQVFGDELPRRFFRPLGQVREADVYLHLATAQPPALVDPLRRELQKTAPDALVLSIRPFADYVEKNINTLLVRLAGIIFGVFGGIALVLAVVGVYAVKAYAVVRRTREIGVRMALGARRRDVMSLILKQGALQTAVGVGLGLALALIAGRVLSRMLYRVDAADPIALVASAAILTVAVLLACWLPARRATKVDPLVALRSE